MPGKKRFVLAALSASLAVGPVGTAVAAPERPAGSPLGGQIAVVTSLTELNGDDFSENALVSARSWDSLHGGV